MYKKISFIFFVIFCLSSCTSKNIKNKLSEEDYSKLQKVISLVKNHYIEDIYIEERIDINITNVDKQINNIMNNLDKNSIYINKDYKSIKKFKKTNHKISFKIIDKKYLYILIPYFYKNVSKDLAKIINEYNLPIILDLRDNVGGHLKEAIKTVDLFIDKGEIISQVPKNKNLIKRYYATANSTITSATLVVLINDKTASSSEIVSGTLQDYKRATLIGTQTYGKGTIQALIYISKNKKEAIKLTVAKYYLPSKREINNKIKADIFVKEKELQLEKSLRYLNKLEKLTQMAK